MCLLDHRRFPQWQECGNRQTILTCLTFSHVSHFHMSHMSHILKFSLCTRVQQPLVDPLHIFIYGALEIDQISESPRRTLN